MGHGRIPPFVHFLLVFFILSQNLPWGNASGLTFVGLCDMMINVKEFAERSYLCADFWAACWPTAAWSSVFSGDTDGGCDIRPGLDQRTLELATVLSDHFEYYYGDLAGAKI